MKIIQSKSLKQFTNLTHGFTTKHGGKSVSPYSSLNLAFHVNDDVNTVTHNHTLLAKKLHYDKRALVHMNQIHSNFVHTIEKNDTFENPPTCDALITHRTNIPLMVMVADCSPILFYDDVQKVIAVAHAGRAGAFKNIIGNVIDKFKKNYHSNVEDILVSVGPSIGECCYEVGHEIYDEAKALNLEYALNKKESHYHLDISEILKNQLLNTGVKKEHIEISQECTFCQNSTYFSYRADGITGRCAGVISLN